MDIKYPEIQYTVRIRQVSSGKEVDYHPSITPWEDDGGYSAVKYMFEDGNYSCDCNREIFFYRAQQQEIDQDAQICSSSKYLVRTTLDANGVVVTDELGA